jgi:hypothetical protein
MNESHLYAALRRRHWPWRHLHLRSLVRRINHVEISNFLLLLPKRRCRKGNSGNTDTRSDHGHISNIGASHFKIEFTHVGIGLSRVEGTHNFHGEIVSTGFDLPFTNRCGRQGAVTFAKRNRAVGIEKEFRSARLLVLHLFQLIKLVLTTDTEQGRAGFLEYIPWTGRC